MQSRYIMVLCLTIFIMVHLFEIMIHCTCQHGEYYPQNFHANQSTFHICNVQLEQLEFLIFKFRNKLYTWHTFWSCLIRCANMKWIQWVLLKIQSWQHSVHRRTEGKMDRRTRWNQYTPLFNFVEAGSIIIFEMIQLLMLPVGVEVEG